MEPAATDTGIHTGNDPATLPVVAFDVGPLSGPRTGIGSAVAALQQALQQQRGLQLAPYLTSFRTEREPGVSRLPLPAALAHRLWAHVDHPCVDRWVRPAQVVHGTNYVVPPTTLPRLVSVYDCWFLRHPNQAHPDVVRAGRVLVRAIDRGAVVHASSQATATALRQMIPTAEVHVVHLAAIPLPPPTSHCPIPELVGTDFVLAVATIERRKNLPRLVAAFGSIARRHHALRLVIAGGNGDDRSAVDAAIDALPSDVGARVMMTGYVSDDARSWLLHHARVLAYPSLDEGFGFPLLDAMQVGLPIVASTAGSIPEVAGATALTVEADDVEALGEALHRVLVDDDVRAELIAAAPGQLERFTWAGTAQAMVTLYSDLYRRDTG